MAPGANFTLTPNEVIPLEPEYHTIITPSEAMKKEYLNISTTPIERYQLNFSKLSNTDKELLLTHFKDNSGGYYPFSWTSVPSYIGGGTSMTGRWVIGSLKMSPVWRKYWACQITFEKAVA